MHKLKKEAAELREGYGPDLPSSDEEDPDLLEALNRWMNQSRFLLVEDEIPHLEALLQAAEPIDQESKITRIAEIIDRHHGDRSILLFTEYKATQALVVSTLMARFGEESVGFINGDDRLEGVCRPSGDEAVLTANREATADAFNQGRIRFLVSTEAGGEGIDLQGHCHTLSPRGPALESNAASSAGRDG